MLPNGKQSGPSTGNAEWLAPKLASSFLVLESQPPEQSSQMTEQAALNNRMGEPKAQSEHRLVVSKKVQTSEAKLLSPGPKFSESAVGVSCPFSFMGGRGGREGLQTREREREREREQQKNAPRRALLLEVAQVCVTRA